MVKYLGRSYLYYFLIVSLNIYLSNGLIEIPFKTIEVEEVPKYKGIKIKRHEVTNNSNKTPEEGEINLSPSLLFLANIKIGSDEQEFNLLLDTGSSVLWVAGTDSEDKSELQHHYSTTSSKTSKATNEEFGVIYGTAKSKGYYYTDDIKYINDKKFNMKFGVANYTEFSVTGADGIIGLANFYSDESLSFVRMMEKGGVTDSKIFSFKLEGDQIGSKGKMYIGKHEDFSSDNSFSCPLIKFNSPIDAYWIATIGGFSVKKNNNEIKSSKSCNIMFDTGTNVILLPYDYLNDIKNDLSKVNCTINKYSDDYDQLKCKVSSDNSLPDFRFKINNYYLTVPYNHCYYTQGPDRNYYYSLVFFMQKSETYIIGSPFFVTFHTLFDGDSGNLSFYSENSKYMEKEEENKDENEDENEEGNKEDEKEDEKENKEDEKGNKENEEENKGNEEEKKENEEENKGNEEEQKENEEENKGNEEEKKENEGENKGNEEEYKENEKESDGNSKNNDGEKDKSNEGKKSKTTLVISLIVVSGIIILIIIVFFVCRHIRRKKEQKELEDIIPLNRLL